MYALIEQNVTVVYVSPPVSSKVFKGIHSTLDIVKSIFKFIEQTVCSRPKFFINLSQEPENVTELSEQKDADYFVQFLRKVSKHDAKRLETPADSNCFILCMLSCGIVLSSFDFIFKRSLISASKVSYCNNDPSGHQAICRNKGNESIVSVMFPSDVIRADRFFSADMETPYFKTFSKTLQGQ